MPVFPEDLPHLHNIGYGGILRSATPEDVTERLVMQGHARITTGGTLMLTEAGYKILGRPSCFIEMGKR